MQSRGQQGLLISIARKAASRAEGDKVRARSPLLPLNLRRLGPLLPLDLSRLALGETLTPPAVTAYSGRRLGVVGAVECADLE